MQDEDTTTTQVNAFNGLNRRIERDETGGSGKHIHFYYNESWQVLEERVESSGTVDSNPLNQYVWGPNYVDEMAIRYYDQNTDGLFIQKYAHQHDALYNVIGVSSAVNGDALENVTYTPYGEPIWLNNNFSEKSTQGSTIGNEFLYTGRRLSKRHACGKQASAARSWPDGLS